MFLHGIRIPLAWKDARAFEEYSKWHEGTSTSDDGTSFTHVVRAVGVPSER